MIYKRPTEYDTLPYEERLKFMSKRAKDYISQSCKLSLI